MSAYVYHTSLRYNRDSDFVDALREKVSDLKSDHPELINCSLADVSFQRNQGEVDVTLYFQPKS